MVHTFSSTAAAAVPLAAFLVAIFIIAAGPVSQVRGDQLTAQETALVTKFRPLIKNLIYKDYMNTDEYLIRWLRSVGYDMLKAKLKLENAMIWRKKNKMDSIITEDFSQLEKAHPLYITGSDKTGHPLALFNLASVDYRKIILTGRKKELIRYYERNAEIIERTLHLTPSNISKIFVIIDTAGYNLKQHGCIQCIELIPRFLRTLDSYYPDRLYKYYLLNTPRPLATVYESVQQLLDEPTRKAISVFTHDKDEWKEKILKEIDRDQLTVRFGGTLPQSVLEKTFKEQARDNKLLEKVFQSKDK